jgi:hypothetical protein
MSAPVLALALLLGEASATAGRGLAAVAPGPSTVERRDEGHWRGMERGHGAGRASRRLLPLLTLDPVIRLDHGRVACVRCHDVERPGLVVRPAARSLCLACHEL